MKEFLSNRLDKIIQLLSIFAGFAWVAGHFLPRSSTVFNIMFGFLILFLGLYWLFTGIKKIRGEGASWYNLPEIFAGIASLLVISSSIGAFIIGPTSGNAFAQVVAAIPFPLAIIFFLIVGYLYLGRALRRERL